MKRVITRSSKNEVFVNNLLGEELVAYRCQNSPGVAVLAKLRQSVYAFVPLNNSNSKPRFEANTWYNSIELASKQRELFVFENQDKLIEAIYTKAF